jgi:hypothetical protein
MVKSALAASARHDDDETVFVVGLCFHLSLVTKRFGKEINPSNQHHANWCQPIEDISGRRRLPTSLQGLAANDGTHDLA